MHEARAFQRELEALQRRNDELMQRAVNAEQVMAAFARGEIDAVTFGAAETPVLLHAAQEKLRNSQQLLRAIFDGALEPMMLTDREGRYVDANPAACALYGLSLEQLVGRKMSEFTRASRDDDTADRGFRERDERRGTFALQRTDGTRRIVEFSWVSNVAIGLDLSVMRDITDRVFAELAVQRSEARFRTLTEKSADVIVLLARDGTTLYVSPSVSQMLGWTPEEMAGSDRTLYVLPEDLQRVAVAHQWLLREAGEISFEFRALHRDGSTRWVEASARNLLADPNVAALVANLRDVTARVRAEQRSQESHHRLEEAQAIAHVGSWTLGLVTDGQIRLSREAARIFGAAEDVPLTLASFLQIVHNDDRQRFRSATQEALRRGGRADIEHRIQRADGSVRWVHERGVVERDEQGLPIRMDGTVQDVTDHRLAVEALRTSEEEFRLLAEAMPQIVWITRPDGGNLYFNQQWVDYTGLSLEQSRGHGWHVSFHPDDQERAAQAWREATTTAGTYALECRLRRADGAYRWWLIRGVPVKDAGGAIIKWFGTCTDVDALKESKERLRVLHDVAEVMLTQVDPLQAVPAALRVLGEHLRAARCAYAVVDADGEHCEVVHEYVDGCVSLAGRHTLRELGASFLLDLPGRGEPHVVCDVDTEIGERALRTAGVRAFVCCSLLTEGTVRALMFVHDPVPHGWTSGEISIVQGVLDRCWTALEMSAAAAKLRENEALLRIAGRAARLGGWSVALPDFRLTWSEEVCAIHEVPAGTTPSAEQAFEYYAPEFREIIRDKVSVCLQDGTPFDLELQIVTATGRRIWVRAIGNAERNFAGAITTMRGAFQDIDDRRKLQDQFRHAQKMEAVGRLAGGVAHDFNNILSVILSYSELAIESLKVGDPLRADIEEIRGAGQRATGLTRQLLAFSRQQVLEPRVIDLNEIVDEMKPMLCRLLGEDVVVTVLTPLHVGRVLADPSQIEQVVMNLAVNARDSMPDGGKLTIETCNVTIDESHVGKHSEVRPGQFVMLAMVDSGTGMSEATLARAFEPFFTTKEKGKGTGLGLATVFGIVQQSGGYVTVDSTPKLGTTFKIYLPRTDQAVKAQTSVAPSAVRGGSETILLVEDEDQVRAVACTVLRRHGYVVLETSNGGEAFLIANDFAGRIDLLLTDVIMPRVSGRRLAEQLTAQRPEMKVLFASGYTDDEIGHHGVLATGVAFLQKPFTPKALLKRVRESLDNAGGQREGEDVPRRP